MANFAEVRLPITLDRGRFLVFNLNTMIAYEQATRTEKLPEGKFYWDTILKLFETHERANKGLPAPAKGEQRTAEERQRLFRELSQAIPAEDVRALLWASLHHYEDGSDEPMWDITLEGVGRLIRPLQVFSIVQVLLAGHGANAPTRAELGEASGVGAKTPTSHAATPVADATLGTERSIALPADALG